VWESRVSNPLVPVRVLRSRNLLCAGISRAMFCFGSYGSFFLLVLYLQEVLGYGSLGNGLAFLPNTVFLSVLTLTLSPHLMARIGSKRTHVIGLSGFACGLLILVFLPVDGSFWVNIFPAMAVLGISGGTFTVPNTTIAMAESNSGDSGVVSGVINVAQQMGAALGIALLASVSSVRTGVLAAEGESHHAALVGGFHLGFLVAFGALVVGVTAGLFVRPDAVVVPDDPVTSAAMQISEIELL
jgi:MFS family permease